MWRVCKTYLDITPTIAPFNSNGYGPPVSGAAVTPVTTA